VLQPGAGPEWNRKPYLLALGLAAVLYWILQRRNHVDVPRTLLVAACLLPSWLVLQLLPLPLAFLSAIDPARGELLRGLASIGQPQRFATISIAPEVTMGAFLLVCGYAVTFLMLYHLAAHWEGGRWALAMPLVIVGVLEAGLGVAQGNAGQVASGTYVNRDHYSGLLELILPFCVAYPLAIWERADLRRQFPLRPALRMSGALLAGALMLAAVLSSLSRMGFVAALCSIAVVVCVSRVGRRSILLWTGGAVAVVLVCFLLLPSDQLISRFGDLSNRATLTSEARVQLWSESLGLYRAYPILGCGLGTFEMAFLRFKSVAPGFTVDYAHNDYLQFLIELGAAGFLIGAILIGAAISRMAGALARRYDPDTRLLAAACLGAFAAIGLHSLVDFNLYVPANAMALAWIAGLGSGLRESAKIARRKAVAGLPQVIDVVAESVE
jgi:O-antigen ligase